MVSNAGGPARGAGTGSGRAMVLVRQLPTTDPVKGGDAHLLPLPLRSADGRREVLSALCGACLHIARIETVRPGHGLWCTYCFVAHVTGSPAVARAAASPPDATLVGVTGTEVDSYAGRLAAGVAYQRLGWPVDLRRHEVSLDLELAVDAVALIIPTVLATAVADLLVRRRCPPPVLAHPAMPAHRVIVAGERFPVPLDWPAGVYRTTGTLLLPPTVTDRGPICWVRPPQPHALRLCREVDVVAALRAALSTPPHAPNS